MAKTKEQSRGMVLFIVLAVFFVVIVIANFTMGFISSQARLTHHSVSRIQAEYAAKAGMLYAYDKLRSGAWVVNAVTPSLDHYLCRAATGCPGVASERTLDASLPSSLKYVYINVAVTGWGGCSPPSGSGSKACITARAEYAGTMN
jgi:Tfp pilus assembly protein PilX